MPLIQVVSLLLCLTTLAAAQKREGDTCWASPGGNPSWICKVLQECPAGLKLIKDRKTPPSNRRCNFKGPAPMVCCPPYFVRDWNSYEPVSDQTPVSPPPPSPTPGTTPPTSPTRRPEKLPSIWERGPSKAAKMCQEYSKEIYVVETVTSLISGSSSGSPKKEKRCTMDVPLIVGGENAEAKEFPHMALLGYSRPPQYRCGGSLISEKFVLSAAHCERHPKLQLVQSVLLGELNLASETEDSDPQSFKVVRRIVHEGYVPTSTYNDIMLLEIERPVKFSLYIRPLCLQIEKNIKEVNGTATGWGALGPVSRQSSILQKISLPFVDFRQCYASYEQNVGTTDLKDGIRDETQLCAGGQKNKDSCPGDSGGPLQIPLGDCMYSQVGVISFGRWCGTEGSPGVYTRVSAYIPWIEKYVWP